MCYLKGIFDNQMIILLNMNLEGIKGCHMGEGGVKIAKKMPCGSQSACYVVNKDTRFYLILGTPKIM